MTPPLPELVERNRARIAEVAKKFRVETLDLFGSAATGEFDLQRSDLDFLVRFHPLAPEEHADAYFGLLEALEDLFGRPVDLLEEEAVLNPYLKRSIDRSRRLLYAA